MIANDVELACTQDRIRRFRKQVRHMEKASKYVNPVGTGADGFIAEIEKMRGEVREYLATRPGEEKVVE